MIIKTIKFFKIDNLNLNYNEDLQFYRIDMFSPFFSVNI